MAWFKKKEGKEEEETSQVQTEFPRYESNVKPVNTTELQQHQQALYNHRDMPPLKRPPTMQQSIQPLPVAPVGSEKVLVRKSALPFPQPVYQQPPRPEMIRHEDIPVTRDHPSTLRPSLIDKGQIPKEEPLKQGKTIFVKVGQYQDAMEKVSMIMKQIDNAEDTISKLEKLREQEMQEVQTWKKELEDIKTRLKTVDMALFGK